MGTKRRGTARSKTTPGRARPGGRSTRNRHEKIPIPPMPAFLQTKTRAPEKTHEPGNDSPLGVTGHNVISDEEADLLLGVTSLAEPDQSQPAPDQPPVSELPEGALTEDEADELLGLAPGTAAVPTVALPDPSPTVESDASARSGASGATVLNELVDEIERDLERDLDRHGPTTQARKYGRIIGCWVSPLADASHLHPPEAIRKEQEEEPR